MASPQIIVKNGQPYLQQPDGLPGSGYMSPTEVLSMIGSAYATGGTVDPQILAWAKANGVSWDPSQGDAGIVDNSGNNTFGTGYTWNPNTGQYDQSSTASKVGSEIIGGIATAGIGDAVAGGALTNSLTGATVGGNTGLPAGVTLEGTAAGDTGAISTPAAQGLADETPTAFAPDGTLADTSLTPGASSLSPNLASTDTVSNLGGLPSVAPSGAVPAATGSAAGSLLGKVGSALQAGSQMTGAATQAAGQNAQNNANNASNAVNAWVQLAKEQDAQQQQAKTNLYSTGVLLNPTSSPYDPNPPKISPTVASGMSQLQQTALQRLQQPNTFDTSSIPSYVPGTPGTLGMPANPSTLANVGTWLTPGLNLAGTIAKLWGS